MKTLTKAIIFGAASSMALVSAPASAEVFNYTSDNWPQLGGQSLNVSIDTNAQTATFTGAGTNFTLTSPALANWTNASLRRYPATMNATAASGVLTFPSGEVIDINNQRMAKFAIGTSFNKFWVGGTDARGNYKGRDLYNHYNGYTFTGSTGGGSTSGGTTSGGTTSGGTTSGGTTSGGATSTSTSGGTTSGGTTSGGATSTSTGGISSTSGGATSGGTTTGGTTTGGTTTGGTTTGGTTTGGTTSGGGSSGGTPVPAPGILGLFGLAIAAVGLGRRRRKITA